MIWIWKGYAKLKRAFTKHENKNGGCDPVEELMQFLLAGQDKKYIMVNTLGKAKKSEFFICVYKLLNRLVFLNYSN